jgi:hypothetical protein
VKLPRPQLLYPLLLLTAGDRVVALPTGASARPFSGPRAVFAIFLAFAPIFLANLVFRAAVPGVGVGHDRVRCEPARCDHRRRARVHALHQRAYRFLLVLVAVLYLAAFLTTPRKSHALT